MFTNNTASDARALFAKNLRNELDRAERETYASKGAFDLAMKISAMLSVESILVSVMPKSSDQHYKLPVSNLRKIAEMIEDYAVDFCDDDPVVQTSPVKPNPGLFAGAVNIVEDNYLPEGIEPSGAFEDCECPGCQEKRAAYAKEVKAKADQVGMPAQTPSPSMPSGVRDWFDKFTIPAGIRPAAKKPEEAYDKPFAFPGRPVMPTRPVTFNDGPWQSPRAG